MELSERHRFVEEPSRRKIFTNNLIGGLAWGVGSVIGATIVIGVLGFFLARLQEVPFVGRIIDNVTMELQQGQEEIQDLEVDAN